MLRMKRLGSVKNKLNQMTKKAHNLILKRIKKIAAIADVPPSYQHMTNFPSRQQLSNGAMLDMDNYTITLPSNSQATGKINGFPTFRQTDNRWKDKKFNGGTMAQSGCGPTAIAMLLQAHGKKNATPYAVAQIMANNGANPDGDGCTKDDINKIAKAYGLQLEPTTDIDSIRNALKKGIKVLVTHGKGMFTGKGHFLIYTGLTKDGKVLIADPNQGGLYNKMGDNHGWDLKRVLKDLASDNDVWAWIDYTL